MSDAPVTPRTCFVITPLGEPVSDTRKRSDQVLRHVIEPAVHECGYAVIRADQLAAPGMITDQVIRHLIDVPLVIADLTDHNPNVFYELAVRHVTKKPVVQIIQRGQTKPFNVAGMRIVEVDHHDLDDVLAARAEIAKQIVVLEASPDEMESPISHALSRRSIGSDESFFVNDWTPHQLHHVSLAVHDVNESRRFYRDVLELREVKRADHFDFAGTWFLLPSGQQLHLLENKEGTYRSSTEVDYRDVHFALRVRDFRKAEADLREKNHPLTRIWELSERYIGGYLLDPDNHVIEINTGNYAEVKPQFV